MVLHVLSPIGRLLARSHSAPQAGHPNGFFLESGDFSPQILSCWLYPTGSNSEIAVNFLGLFIGTYWTLLADLAVQNDGQHLSTSSASDSCPACNGRAGCTVGTRWRRCWRRFLAVFCALRLALQLMLTLKADESYWYEIVWVFYMIDPWEASFWLTFMTKDLDLFTGSSSEYA